MEKRNQLKDSFRQDAFPVLELWAVFGGGGAFRSGVQPPTGTRTTGTGRDGPGWAGWTDGRDRPMGGMGRDGQGGD